MPQGSPLVPVCLVFPEHYLLDPFNSAATTPNSVPQVENALLYTALALTAAQDIFGHGTIPYDPQPSFLRASDSTSVGTVAARSGLVTGTGVGTCNITAHFTVSGQAVSGVSPFGCALISPASATLNYGGTQNFTATGRRH
jgi:hypothetical protein